MRYRKKPIEVEAVQYDAMSGESLRKILAWCNNATVGSDGRLYIGTLEGVMRACDGDYIIKGVRGEFYPCKQDIFEDTYEPA